ncbi:CaiB/BaiF CoA-transferase family protein [Desulfosarcina cetonica]|uniref:CaiB/BaiF CoA transferase family protein n=1 Tax=Desulfosarcina cetonica TaxID=90730 RepID=UPI0006CF7C8E|nr:CoA transferase [Desulfosarcina cetonica]
MEDQHQENSLQGLKVLDFTGELGPYAAKLYAGLGADVIHLESPAGDPLRRRGPFYKNQPGPDSSLQFLYYNAGKRGMALDITRDAGKEIFLQLCADADLLFDSFAPGYLDGLGLSYDRLSAVNPRLIQTAITPFGSVGPYKDFPGCDLTCSAMGGFLFLAGIDNDKPVRACDDQAFRMAEAYAAVGSSTALLFAQRTGIGQFIDVACMESVGMALENAAQYWDLEGKNRRGRGTEAGSATVHPCKDGFIAIVAIMGSNKVMWDPFAQWMQEENIEEWEAFQEDCWIEPAYRKSKAGYERFCRIFERFTLQQDKLTLYEKGQAHRVALTPVSDGGDLLANPQLRYRDFWKTIYHENLGGEVTYPGAPYEFGALEWRLGDPAPTLGQHTAEILRGLDYAESEISALAKEGIIHVG